MKNRATLIIKQKIMAILFIAAAAAIGIFMFWYIHNLRSEIPQNENLEQVVIASADIEAGKVLKESMLKIQDVPQALASERTIQNFQALVGEKSLKDIKKGEIIYSTFISGQAITNHVNPGSYIPQGKRLISVPVTYCGPVDLLSPGHNIDLISVYYQQSEGVMATETVISQTEMVMAAEMTDQDFNPELFSMETQSDVRVRPEGLAVSMYVTPLEAEAIFLALERGAIHLSLCPEEIFNY